MKSTWKNRFLLLAVIPVVLATFLIAPGSTASTQASNRNPLENIPITGTVVNNGTFQGTFSVVSFAQDPNTGALLANGLLSGTLRDANGNVIGRISNEYETLPATLTDGPSQSSPSAPAPAQTCSILHLTLGPLDLNLLGLMVHLNRVVLDITAQGGPGNLLGNLLCAIAHLLDGGQLSQVVTLLNRVIDLLGSL